ncbi:MAG: hypothetical protein C0408_09230, partial [Odoribacter sp.]|nr:hypothetical protein [Odoribacter sp.]
NMRHPLNLTAMGKGLMDGKNKLLLGSPGLKKHVILFTDGMQNVFPRVNADGNTLEDGSVLNDAAPAEQIRYHTMGVEAAGFSPTILTGIASTSYGKYHLNNGTASDYVTFFESILVDMLSGSSPQIVFRETGYHNGTESIQEYILNNNISKMVIRLEYPANAGLTMKIEKDGVEIVPDSQLPGSFYLQNSFLFPSRKSTSSVQSGGKWKVRIFGRQTANYRIVGIADDHFFKFTCTLNKPLYTVGDSLNMTVKIRYADDPLTDASNKILALVLKPGEDLGDLLSRTDTPELHDTLDVTSEAQQKFLQLLQTDTAFFNALLPTRRLIQLTHTGEGIYTGSFDSTGFAGIYKIYFLLNGAIPGKGNFQRLELQDALFNFGRLDTKETEISVTVDPASTAPATGTSGTGTTATITVRPVNKYTKYLGPGFDTQIKVDVKDRPFSFKPKWIPLFPHGKIMKSGIADDSIQVREIKDMLNGSYNIVLVNIPENSDPFLRVTVMGEVLKTSRLSQFCSKGSSDSLWIIIISIFFIIILILRYFKSMGPIYRLPQWFMVIIILIWLIIIVLQKTGLITLLSSSCF